MKNTQFVTCPVALRYALVNMWISVNRAQYDKLTIVFSLRLTHMAFLTYVPYFMRSICSKTFAQDKQHSQKSLIFCQISMTHEHPSVCNNYVSHPLHFKDFQIHSVVYNSANHVLKLLEGYSLLHKTL